MGQFFKFVFASCLGLVLAGILLMVIGGAAIGSLISKESQSVSVKPNSVLELKLNTPIPERTNNIPRDFSSFDIENILGVHDIVDAIEGAKEDDNIKGIFLNMNGASGGQATKSLIRDALSDFKDSGKFIYAYSKAYSQGDYYLASVADKVYLNPVGGMDFRGFGAQLMFVKNMLDELGIKMQVFYAGKFKGATEIFRRTDLSEENRLQIRQYIDGLYEVYLDDISRSRKISVPELKNIADEFLVRSPEDALSYKMVDVLGYYDEVESAIKERIGSDEDDKLKKISLSDYAKTVTSKSDFSVKDRIAVVYAEGGIDVGEGDPGTIGDEKYMKILRKIRRDDKIKAMVLRVNSGGGSALASDNIWREIQLIKEAGKSVVVSMGNVAASGGYYIACDADKIYAQDNTITGSIGVFATIPSTQNFMNEKLGITFDTVSTGEFSNSLSLVYDVKEKEGQIIQESVEEIYETFLKRVSEGRGMTRDAVHEIAQGRVWTGLKAKEIGLVDEIGGLDEAITAAQELAGLEKYRMKEYPLIKDPMEQIIEDIMGKKDAAIKAEFVKTEFKELYPYYKKMKTLKEMKGAQMRMPFEIEVK